MLVRLKNLERLHDKGVLCCFVELPPEFDHAIRTRVVTRIIGRAGLVPCDVVGYERASSLEVPAATGFRQPADYTPSRAGVRTLVAVLLRLGPFNEQRVRRAGIGDRAVLCARGDD